MDPSGRRARNLVLLLVFSVALPSLLLTVLAGVAVSDEEAASRTRLELQYKPFVQKSADRFNSMLDGFVAEAQGRLGELIAWARARDGDALGRRAPHGDEDGAPELDRASAEAADAAAEAAEAAREAAEAAREVAREAAEAAREAKDGHPRPPAPPGDDLGESIKRQVQQQLGRALQAQRLRLRAELGREGDELGASIDRLVRRKLEQELGIPDRSADVPEPPEFSAWSAAPYAVNAFVVSADGRVLAPRPPRWGEDPATAMPVALREAQAAELADPRDAKACDGYRRLVESRAGGRGAERAPGECLERYALLLCEEDRRPAGAPAVAPDLRARLGEGCEGLAGDEIAARGPEARRQATACAGDRAPFLDAAARLVVRLSSPTLRSSAWLQEFTARDLAGRLSACSKEPRASSLRRSLLSVAERPALLLELTRLSHPREKPATTSFLTADGWRRVLVTRTIESTLGGYELVSSAFDAAVSEALPVDDLPVAADAIVWPVAPPAFWSPSASKAEDLEMEQRTLGWALLKKSGLAWMLAIIAREPDSLFNLNRSRTQLYVWTLVLLVGALVAGIVWTVRAVVREARQTRLKVDFVSSVSHDLRTPLTSIRMFTETLLLGRVRSRDEERGCLEVIAQETERLSRLTQRILDFSRMEAGRRVYQQCDLKVADLVRTALDACRPLVEQDKFTVEVDVAPDAGVLRADRDSMVEVLVNLITNAIKYSPDEKYLRIAARRTDGFVELSIQDRGIGIPRAEQARIFEKFYRVDCRRTTEVGGSGIGLSLVDHIVRAHHGEVRVDSEPGRGSTFTVRLPLQAPPPSDAREATS